MQYNLSKRQAAEKSAKSADVIAKQKNSGNTEHLKGNSSSNNGHNSGNSSGGKTDKENIFGSFHNAQEASSDSVLAEFKQKLAKRLQK